jgi:hypothetical protein
LGIPDDRHSRSGVIAVACYSWADWACSVHAVRCAQALGVHIPTLASSRLWISSSASSPIARDPSSRGLIRTTGASPIPRRRLDVLSRDGASRRSVLAAGGCRSRASYCLVRACSEASCLVPDSPRFVLWRRLIFLRWAGVGVPAASRLACPSRAVLKRPAFLSVSATLRGDVRRGVQSGASRLTLGARPSFCVERAADVESGGSA